jgi:hypothetical protein
LPKQILGRAKISRARLFVSGDNLWTLTKFSGTDPEVVLGDGVSSIKYPISKKVVFGFNMSF